MRPAHLNDIPRVQSVKAVDAGEEARKDEDGQVDLEEEAVSINVMSAHRDRRRSSASQTEGHEEAMETTQKAVYSRSVNRALLLVLARAWTVMGSWPPVLATVTYPCFGNDWDGPTYRHSLGLCGVGGDACLGGSVTVPVRAAPTSTRPKTVNAMAHTMTDSTTAGDQMSAHMPQLLLLLWYLSARSPPARQLTCTHVRLFSGGRECCLVCAVFRAAAEGRPVLRLHGAGGARGVWWWDGRIVNHG